MLQRLLQQKDPAALKAFIGVAAESVTTDLTPADLLALAQSAISGGLRMDNVEAVTMPYTCVSAQSRAYQNAQSYVVPKGEELLTLVNERFNSRPQALTPEDLELMSVDGDGALHVTSGVLADGRVLQLTWPLAASGEITSNFGVRVGLGENPTVNDDHICIAAAPGDPVIAAWDGTVEKVGDDPALGSYLLLGHGGGVRTQYAHLSKITVKEGDTVTAGARMGEAGATGEVTGPCLAFWTFENGVAVDPLRYFSEEQWERPQ